MKYSVISYVFNNYELPREVQNPDPDVEYILVTDDENTKLNTWKVIVDHDLDGLSVFDKCYSVRFNCFKYCSTDICIRIDGSMEIVGSLDYLVDKLNEGGYVGALMVHPWRNNVLEEYAVWVQTRGYSHQQANQILNSMMCTGYDISYKGLYQGCISIQRRCKISDDIDRMVMALLKYFGDEQQIERLDQTITSMVINKWFNNVKFLPLSQRILGGKPFNIYPHNEKKSVGLILDVPNIPYHFNFEQMPYADKGFLFNEEVDLVW